MIVGEAVFELLEDKSFLAQWDALYQSCCWATPYQSKEYVRTWYRLYSDKYLPIVVKAQGTDTLEGLLTLALPVKKAKGKKQFIVAAGHHDSDYQAWLTPEADGGAFMKGVISKLWKQFPRHELMLKYLPSQIPLDWINSDRFWQHHCALQPFTVPLIDVKTTELSKRDKKRIGRINKLARFERVTDLKTFCSLLNTQLAQLFDFRQGAMFNKNPFRNDPANKQLLLSMFAAGLLHVTVLKAGEEVIASVAATIRKNRAFLGGINCHSPLYSAYSPGYAHFLLLGQQLAREGFDSFDLTPGYDFYKERMATRHEQVHQLVVTQNRFYFVKRQVRRWFHGRMVRVGIRPLSMELEIRKGFYLLRQRGLAASLSGWVKNHWPKNKPRVLVAPSVFSPFENVFVKKDSLGDLLEYDQQGGKLTRWEFLETALRRFERGEHCYTWTEGNRLLACIWDRGAAPLAKDQDGIPTAPGVFLGNLYCHAAGRARLDSFLKSAVAQAGSDLKEVHALATNAFMRRAFEVAGFRKVEEKRMVEQQYLLPERFPEFELKRIKSK